MTSSPDLINRTEHCEAANCDCMELGKLRKELSRVKAALGAAAEREASLVKRCNEFLMRETTAQAHWDMINIEAYWIPECYETGEKSLRRMPFCSRCQHAFGLAALRYKRCPECGAHITGTVERNDVVYTKETADGDLVVKEG